MLIKSVATFFGSAGLSISFLGLTISDNLMEIIVVLLSALIIALLQLAISFLKGLVDKSKLDKADKDLIKDLLDKLKDEAVEEITKEKDKHDRDERPDNKSGPGD